MKLWEIFKPFMCGLTTSSEPPVKGLMERWKVIGMVWRGTFLTWKNVIWGKRKPLKHNEK